MKFGPRRKETWHVKRRDLGAALWIAQRAASIRAFSALYTGANRLLLSSCRLTTQCKLLARYQSLRVSPGLAKRSVFPESVREYYPAEAVQVFTTDCPGSKQAPFSTLCSTSNGWQGQRCHHSNTKLIQSPSPCPGGCLKK